MKLENHGVVVRVFLAEFVSMVPRSAFGEAIPSAIRASKLRLQRVLFSKDAQTKLFHSGSTGDMLHGNLMIRCGVVMLHWQ